MKNSNRLLHNYHGNKREKWCRKGGLECWKICISLAENLSSVPALMPVLFWLSITLAPWDLAPRTTEGNFTCVHTSTHRYTHPILEKLNQSDANKCFMKDDRYSNVQDPPNHGYHLCFFYQVGKLRQFNIKIKDHK